MSDTPHLGPAPRRITVDAEQVRRLVADQFPQWADLPVAPVANGGWDNWTFHLGARMSVRLPSAAEYALAVDKEHRWLPALAAHSRCPSSDQEVGQSLAPLLACDFAPDLRVEDFPDTVRYGIEQA